MMHVDRNKLRVARNKALVGVNEELVSCCPVHLFYSCVLCAFYFEQIK